MALPLLMSPQSGEALIAISALSCFLGFILSIIYWIKAARGTAGSVIATISFVLSALALFPYLYYFTQFQSSVARAFGAFLLVPLSIPFLFSIIALSAQSSAKKK